MKRLIPLIGILLGILLCGCIATPPPLNSSLAFQNKTNSTVSPGGIVTSGNLTISTGATTMQGGQMTAILPAATAGQQYITSITVTGGTGPYHCAVSGALPGQLAFGNSGCTISGTAPTLAAGMSSAVYQVSFTVTDSVGNVAGPITLNLMVNGSGTSQPVVGKTVVTTQTAKFQFSPRTLPSGTVGYNYNYSFCQPSPNASTAYACGGTNTLPTDPSGGKPPYYFALEPGNGSLPDGLTLNQNGVFNGTPTAVSIRVFVVCATDQAGNSNCTQMQLTINPQATSKVPVLGTGQTQTLAGITGVTGAGCSSGYISSSDGLCHLECGNTGTYCATGYGCVEGGCCQTGMYRSGNICCPIGTYSVAEGSNCCPYGSVWQDETCIWSSACPEGQILGDDGACHEPCPADSDTYCTGSAVCENGNCVNPNACPAGQVLGQDDECHDACPAGSDIYCISPAVCQDGNCINPNACPGEQVLGEDNACHDACPAGSDTYCTGSDVCDNGQCMAANPCSSGQVYGSDGECHEACPSGSDTYCTGSDVCQNGQCMAANQCSGGQVMGSDGECHDACPAGSDTYCTGSDVCDNGQCVTPCPEGQVMGSDNVCHDVCPGEGANMYCKPGFVCTSEGCACPNGEIFGTDDQQCHPACPAGSDMYCKPGYECISGGCCLPGSYYAGNDICCPTGSVYENGQCMTNPAPD